MYIDYYPNKYEYINNPIFIPLYNPFYLSIYISIYKYIYINIYITRYITRRYIILARMCYEKIVENSGSLRKITAILFVEESRLLVTW